MIYKHANLLECTESAILHSINASNGYGSGVAGHIARLWPQAKIDYHNAYNRGLSLGDVIITHDLTQKNGNPITLFQGVGQQSFGSDGQKYASVDAIFQCMLFVRNYAKHIKPITHVALPRIGCGLGGLDWINDDLENMITYALNPIIPVIYDIDQIKGTNYV